MKAIHIRKYEKRFLKCYRRYDLVSETDDFFYYYLLNFAARPIETRI